MTGWSGRSPQSEKKLAAQIQWGAVALAAAICQLKTVDMAAVAAHEAELTAHALARLIEVPGLRLYRLTDPATAAECLGVAPFTLDGYPHSLLAANLGYAFGIGVRNGCFCAHPYRLHLLGVVDEEAQQVSE